MPNKIKKTKNNKKQDEHFAKVNIQHDPQAESTRAAARRNEDENLE